MESDIVDISAYNKVDTHTSRCLLKRLLRRNLAAAKVGCRVLFAPYFVAIGAARSSTLATRMLNLQPLSRLGACGYPAKPIPNLFQGSPGADPSSPRYPTKNTSAYEDTSPWCS